MKWGTEGGGDGQFQYLTGIEMDASGNLYVSDYFNYRIQKFNSTGTFISKWGSYGYDEGQFRGEPWGVAVDSNENVYVADTWGHRIQKFSNTGTLLAKWGSYGSGDGQFHVAIGIAVDNAGNLYVADYFNHRIQKLSNTGTFITKWGSSGTGDGQFREPEGIAVDGAGNVYVVDTGNHRIQKFTSDGTFITKWDSYGSGDGEFNKPRDIAVDSSGNFYVTECGNHRIQKFRSDGTFLTKWGSRGTADGQFDEPVGIVVDSTGNVYVADFRNNRIQKFAPNVGEAPTASFTATPTTGTAPLAVQFTDESTGDPTSWVWDFGDGSTSNEQHPEKTYTNAGTYTVSLIVTNAGGINNETKNNYITVEQKSPPIANFIGTPTSGEIPLTVQFIDSSIGDPTGWVWFFGDEDFTAAWTQMALAADWSKRSYHTSVVMPDGSILLMGGFGDTNKNDVWRSKDNGISWTQVNSSAGWTARGYHSSLVLSDGSVILMGGYDGNLKNDIWRSTDNGVTWMQLTPSAEWSARRGHSTALLPDGSILLMGGFTTMSGSGTLNDVWRSTDNGVSWTQMTQKAEWSSRGYQSNVVMSDASIVMMGGTGGGLKRDVWRSTDNGISWLQITPDADWSARCEHASVVLPDDSIILIGGWNGSRTNDIWRSTDHGATWMQITSSAEWKVRSENPSSLLMPDGSIIILGGRGNSGLLNDVWRLMIIGSSDQHPAHIYESPGIYSVAMKAYNAVGADTHFIREYITVSESPNVLIANFTSDSVYGLVPFTVNFTDTSIGNPTSWFWDFGDGTTSTEQYPSNTYRIAGIYTVTLTATDVVESDSITRNDYITAYDRSDAPVTITINAGTNEQILAFGTYPNGTDGYDTGLDIIAPPLPPSVSFDAVFMISDSLFPRLYTDIRGEIDDLNTERIWQMEVISKDDDAVISWDPTHLPEDLTCTLTYAGTRYDMKAVATTTIPRAADRTVQRVNITLSSGMEMAIPLSAGWNLVSIPYTDVAYILPSPNPIQVVYAYNPATRSYVITPLDQMQPGQAYWVASTGATEITVIGTDASPITTELATGWNLLGGTDQTVPFSSIKIDPAGAWAMPFVYGYNTGTRAYEQVTVLAPGAGYWGAVTADSTITIPGV
jgi:PKD repeat protein